MVHIISNSYYTSYNADKCSLATCFWALVWIATLLIPFYLAYNQSDFFKKVYTYKESPSVSYSGDLILLVRETNNIYSYSTISNLNEQLTNNPTNPIIQTMMVDADGDDKNELFTGKITFPSDANQVQDISLYLFFNYGLRQNIKLQMTGMVEINLMSRNGISSAQVDGSIHLRQTNPLSVSSMARQIYNITMDQKYFKNGWNPNTFMSEQFHRNETIFIDYNKHISSGAEQKYTTINIKLKVPTDQQIRFVPSYLFTVTQSWISYFAFFFPIYLLSMNLIGWVCTNNIFDIYEVSNLDKNLGQREIY